MATSPTIRTQQRNDDDAMIMDTRTPSPLPANGTSSNAEETTEYKPDLSQEVALLSTKLINAINFQTTLDDQLQQTKHELEMSQRQFEKLQAEKKYLDDMIRDGVLVRRSDVDPVVQSLRAEVSAERSAKEAAEKLKKQTDAELENLTSALFEEANEMVAAARKDSEAAEKRNSQLKSKLSDTEVLLASHQEQLQDLKLTMEKMSERGDNDTTRNSVPSTPVHPPAGLFDGLPISSAQALNPDLPPEHPLFFSSLLVPVLRTDVTVYNDFQELLMATRKAAAAGHVRSSSNGPSQQSNTQSSVLGQFSGSSPNLPGAFSFSNSSSPGSNQAMSTPAPQLKDTKFYRRTLVEDIEPTLRLDTAPGLSFLTRRGVLSSLLQGSLIVEPFPAGGKFVGPIYSCALCGENRKGDQYVRKHRFKTSEEENAQRYPLCDYCLGRVRACGDFFTFLRMVRDGYWRADTEEEQKSAWEESVRLRERMFWARIGGGVVPSLMTTKTATPSIHAVKSPRESLEDEAVKSNDNEQLPALEQGQQRPSTPQADPRRVSLEQKLVDVFQRHRKSLSIGNSLPDFSSGTLSRPNTGDTLAKSVRGDIKPIAEDGDDVERSLPETQRHDAATSIEDAAMDQTTIVKPTSDHSSASSPVEERKASIVSSSSQASSSNAAAVDRRPYMADPPPLRRPGSMESRRTSSSTVASKSPDRKQSGVLARVRAMEAQAQSKQ